MGMPADNPEHPDTATEVAFEVGQYWRCKRCGAVGKVTSVGSTDIGFSWIADTQPRNPSACEGRLHSGHPKSSSDRRVWTRILELLSEHEVVAYLL